MTQDKKLTYLYTFPALPAGTEEKMMEHKGYGNFCIFIASYDVLYVRCYHKYAKKSQGLREAQRYVFAPDGCVRYGRDYNNKWKQMSKFTEPVFTTGLGYFKDNSYGIINENQYKKTCLKYSQVDCYTGNYPLLYFRFYLRHKNAEYLIKSGYEYIVKDMVEGFKGYDIDWHSNNLLKMLRLSRTEFEILKPQAKDYWEYMTWRKSYPELTPQDRINYMHMFGCAFGHF